MLWLRNDLEEPRLDKEVPHSAGLVHVNLDEIASFATTELAPASCVLPHQRLFDDEIRFGQDPKLRAKSLLGRCE